MNKDNIITGYEQLFAEWFKTRSAFAFWKGRVALYAILKAMGVSEGDQIILPGYTCVMNVNPIKYLGAKPVYVDIEPNTFNLNVELLEEKITSNTKAIIAQHTYGYPCDMDSILEIARRKDIPVIEDCCLSLGSNYKSKTVGTFGKASYFSFQWNKPFTTGLGGMAITNDKNLAEKVKSLCGKELRQPSKKEVLMLTAQLAIYRIFIYPRTTALAQTIFRYLTKKGAVVGSSSTSEFEPTKADDFFKAMSSVQVKSGLRQLKKLQQNIEHRKALANLYDKLLEQKSFKIRNFDSTTMEPVMVRYPVRINEKNKALAEASKAGVELGSWFECPLQPIETPLEAYDYEIGMCPEAEKAATEVVNLPVHPRVSERTAKKTVEFITRYTQA
ncbi:MAG: DegT/DnrJ/EryC1/StrS aminotransferase family protein [Sedimentisphaerales bacterium]|nr:DegT/DnrJ/EryC1/StrS aminotransferase family protein [Sedimentisphaerales bacterium]